MTKTPRQVLEWLCSEQPEFWKEDRTINVYALRKALERWAKQKGATNIPAQSTLARLYSGESKEFDTRTADVLSEFFGVPIAIIRGELQLNFEEVWGMDITLAELKILSQLRLLTPEQRYAVARIIAEMLPPDAKPAPFLPRPRATPILPPPPPKPTDKH